jgi:hypothetical protein
MSILIGFLQKYILILLGNSGDTIPIFSSEAAAGSCFVFSLFFQYIIYETKNPNEYYFYYNLGLSKYILWFSNFIFSLILSILIGFL